MSLTINHLAGCGATGMSTPWYLPEFRYVNKVFPFTQVSVATGMMFDSSGLIMILSDSSKEGLARYDLTIPFDVTTAAYNGDFYTVSNPPTGVFADSFFVTPSGLRLYVMSQLSTSVAQFTLGTAWTLSTASYDGIVKTIGDGTHTPASIYVSADGANLYVANSQGTVTTYAFGTPYNLGTLGAVGTHTAFGSPYGDISNGFGFNATGTILCTVSGTTAYRHTLTTPWGISSRVYTGQSVTFSTSSDGVWFPADGTKFYISINQNVYQYESLQEFA